MSEQQDTPDGNEPGALKAEQSGDKADASKPSAGTNIVIYAPKAEADGAAGEAKSPRVTSKWAMRRVSRIVAIASIAAAIGAFSGSLATLGISHLLQQPNAAVASISDEAKALKQMLARLETEFGALKTNTERATKGSAAQLNQTAERIEKLAKVQDESAAKLAKIADTQEKIRAAAASAPPAIAAAPATAAAAPDVTGSIPAAPAKTEARIATAPPILDNWVLAKVSRGGAIVAGRAGFYEVYPGDPLPGAGRVEAVRYQDGRWVVVTQKGLIIKR